MNFSIFRVSEKKYKTMHDIKKYENYMERKLEKDLTPRERLVGSGNLIEDVTNYINGIKLRKNANLATDILLTTSPEWMAAASEEMKKDWINANLDFLKKEFGNGVNDFGNCIYAMCHLDSKTMHISAMIVSKRFDEKKQKFVLSSNKYFDGPEKLSNWQDKYSKAMESFNLNRGIKGSKRHHISVQQYRKMVDTTLNSEDITEICSQACKTNVLEKQVTKLINVIATHKDFNNKTTKEKEDIKKQNVLIFKELQVLKKDKKLFGDTIKALSNLYLIPQNSITKVLSNISQSLENNNSKVESILGNNVAANISNLEHSQRLSECKTEEDYKLESIRYQKEMNEIAARKLDELEKSQLEEEFSLVRER